jgi:hypothetical protein
MTAPNLKSPSTLTTVIGKTAPYNCTGTLSAALSNGSGSGKVLKVTAIRAANVDGINNVDFDLSHYRDGTHTYIAYKVTIPAASTLLPLSREEYLYLEEGDAIYAKASTTTKIDLLISYEDIS